MTSYRTHELGKLSESNIDESVKVCGWVKKVRNLGELIFIDLRDYTGYSQIVIQSGTDIFNEATSLRNEYVVQIEGKVQLRKDINPDMITGMIEVVASSLSIINEAETTPFIIDDETDGLEDLRLKYRYLDIRRDIIHNNLILRNKAILNMRNYLNKINFLEVETPILTKATPEGARDFLVPSRVNKGKFYALPQSPQIYKNLLMIGGIEKYYQVARCFRDEDLRADRQPEFTQFDIEVSFHNEEDMFGLIEGFTKNIFKETINVDIEDKFIRMTYDEVMNKYGVDKPDMRYELFINNVSDIFKDSDFKVFKDADYTKCLVLENKAQNYSRKDIEALEEVVKVFKAKGLAWLKVEGSELKGPIAKFLSSNELQELKVNLSLQDNDLILFVADNYEIVSAALGNLRTYIAEKENLIQEGYKFLWVTDFPLFEFDEEEQRYVACHHPFTMPKDNTFLDNVIDTKARAYDLVLNGYELAGGSIRINQSDIQSKMFEYLGMDDKEAQDKFGFMLDAYKYGAPQHAGIAFGVDRLCMIMLGTENIREVIAFPKNQSARDVMMDCPTPANKQALEELTISITEDK
ncbi:MAG: aspartate--tRNA ligase [Mycoplasmatales bacterium]